MAKMNSDNHGGEDERLSKVSHDMKTPLNAVLGMSDMIIRATDGDNIDINEIHNFAMDIKHAGEELLTLTNDYLYISDVRPGQSEAEQSEDRQSEAKQSDVKQSEAKLSEAKQSEHEQEEHYEPLFYAPKASILVVDDNSINRRVFKNLLRETGIKVYEAEGGFDCIKKLKDLSYDIIFLDYMMPDRDGIETLKAIRASGTENSNKPVIVLTASTVSATIEKLKNSGFSACLSKPVISKELEKTIIEFIPKEKLENVKSSNGNKKSPEEGARPNDLVSMDLARIYANDKEELEGYYRDIKSGLQSGYHQYEVKVHSMKTSALMAKAYEPWALAKSLEEAAENENEDFITSVHSIFIKSWMDMGEQLEKDYLYSCKAKGAHDPEYEIILNYLKLLVKAVEDIDIDSADTLMDMVRSYWYPDELSCHISKLNGAVAGLDICATKQYVSEIERIIYENYIVNRKD